MDTTTAPLMYSRNETSYGNDTQLSDNSTNNVSAAPPLAVEYEWSPALQYGVPVVCLLVFTAILILLYRFPSPHDENQNCVQRCLSKNKAKYSAVEMREQRKQELQSRSMSDPGASVQNTQTV